MPTIEVTAVAIATAETPVPLAGFRVTFVLAGNMLPLGKLLPVTLMLVTPG